MVEKNNSNFVKRNAKASVFAHLFSLTRYKRELYLYFHPRDQDIKDSEIITWTLTSTYTNSIINDLGIIAKDKLLLLVEAQSTWTLNILPRMLVYLAESYNRYLVNTKQNIYGSKIITLPKPEFYVIYSGKEKITNEKITIRKDFFKDYNCPVELEIKVINNDNSSNVVNEYIKFTNIFDTNNQMYGYTKESIMLTINECINKNILKDYFVENKMEVYGMLSCCFDEETIKEMYGWERYREGEEKGIAVGEAKGWRDALVELYKQNMVSKEYAANKLKISVDEFLELAK